MLPETSLPDTALPSCLSRSAQIFGFGYRPREPRLDHPPTDRKVHVIGWQRPYRMHVFRQHDKRVDAKRVSAQRPLSRFAKSFDPLRQKIAAAVQQVDREEPSSAR